MRKAVLTIVILVFIFLQVGKAQKPKLTIQTGHVKSIYDVAYSSDNKYVISGGAGGNLILWDVASGKQIRALKASNRPIYSVAFSPNGKYAVTGSNDEDPKLWDLRTGELLKILGYVEQEYQDMNFSTYRSMVYHPDGRTIYAANLNAIQIFNAATGEAVDWIEAHDDDLNSLDCNGNGTLLVTGSKDKTVKLWNAKTYKQINVLKGHRNDVRSVTFSPNGKYIASAGKDSVIILWDVNTGRRIRTFKNAGTIIYSVKFSPDGKNIASACENKTMMLWNVATGEKIKTYYGHSAFVTSLSYSNNGKNVITGSADRTLKLWSVKDFEELYTFKGNEVNFWSVDVNKQLTNLISGNSDNSIKLWDLGRDTKLKTLSGHTESLRSVDFSPDGKYAVSAAADNKIILWDVITGRKIKTFLGHIDAVNAVKFTVDGEKIVSGGSGKTMKLWDIKTGKEIRSFSGHDGWISSIALTPDGKYAFVGTSYKKSKLWNLATGENVSNIDQTITSVLSVAVSPDGKYCLVGHMDNEMEMYNLSTGHSIKRFMGHRNYVSTVSFSPDGKYALSGSYDKMLILWDVKTGEKAHVYDAHESAVLSASFSSDGKFIFSGSGNDIKILDVKSGKELASLISLPNSNDWVVSSPLGFFDGTQNGMKNIHYVKGMDIIPLESLFENYYTPNLLYRILKGEKLEEPKLNVVNIKLPPLVEIVSPSNNGDLRGFQPKGPQKLNSSKKEIVVTVKATDQGGGIDEIRLYHNGKLVNATQRGYKVVPRKGDVKSKSFTLTLVNGENRIKATAFSSQRTESKPDEIIVNYKGVRSPTDLYMLVIGINKYKNPKYNLNYAIADATAFKKEIENGGSTIFGKTEIVYLPDNKATKQGILDAFNSLKLKAKPNDVFIFYYAGHGVMSEEQNSQFYIIPHDVTQLYGNNDLLRTKGVSAAELQNFSKDLKAQKQLFVFDACQSGGMMQHLAMRGATEEKAIAQLARSTGTFWLAASNSEQFATEFATLGHGLFTYTILQALKGDADGSNKDKKITVKEISAYLNDKVPELSEKYKGSAQYPNSYGYGQDFPVVIFK